MFPVETLVGGLLSQAMKCCTSEHKPPVISVTYNTQSEGATVHICGSQCNILHDQSRVVLLQMTQAEE